MGFGTAHLDRIGISVVKLNLGLASKELVLSVVWIVLC